MKKPLKRFNTSIAGLNKPKTITMERKKIKEIEIIDENHYTDTEDKIMRRVKLSVEGKSLRIQRNVTSGTLLSFDEDNREKLIEFLIQCKIS